MVTGINTLRAQFRRAEENARREVRMAVEKSAAEIAREAQSLAPLPEIKVEWRWGAAEAAEGGGKRRRGGFRRTVREGEIIATVYAGAVTKDFPGGFPALARWWEFGTAPRFQTKVRGRQLRTPRYTGRIAAQPFFFPTVRANGSRLRGRIRRAVNKGFKAAST